MTYWHSSADGSTKSENLSGQHPPHQSNAVWRFVVARNGNVNELGWRISVAETNDWDVGIASLGDWLMIRSWVTDDQETGLTESSLDLISEGSRSETSSNGAAANISENSKVSLRSD